jgi:CysZ protein
LLGPLAQAVGQLDDPVFLGVVVRGLLGSAACFVALHLGVVWAIHRLLGLHGWLGWAADVFGGLGATLLALWLFLPLAVIIASFYIDRIAAAVERRHYPGLPPARGASLASQLGDAMGIAARILLLNALALIAVLVLPGVGIILAWLVGGYAIGRGLFAAVAMRRMPRHAAVTLYRRMRPTVVTQGCILGLASAVPVLNLLIPVIGTAAMVHVLAADLVAHADHCG